MLETAIGLSVLIGFVMSEALGFLTGGLVSAGYLAFFFGQPLRVAATLALSSALALLVRLITRFVIIYGRRRFILTILLSLVISWLFESVTFQLSPVPEDIRLIGYLIPGLIANDMVRQGIVRTLSAVLLSAMLIRLILMAVIPL